MTVFDWRTAWAAVVVHPLFAVALTLIAFQLALMLYRRSGWLMQRLIRRLDLKREDQA